MDFNIETHVKITKSENEWISGYEAGPRYDIEFEYVFEDKTYTGRCIREFDGMHLAYSNHKMVDLSVGASINIEIDKSNPEKGILMMFE